MKKQLQKLTLSAMFLALGLVLPFVTGQIPQIGNMLLPMHIPVLLCGLICGWQYGGSIGLILPLFRHILFSMPPMPGAISMAFELMTYGLIIGLPYVRLRGKGLLSLYIRMIISMITGRIVWGVAQVIVLGLNGNSFGWKAFFAGAFLNAIPGILIQLLLIPAIIYALDRAKLLRFREIL